MLIDAHAHPNYHGHVAEKIVRNLDDQGIDTAWLLTWDAPQSEYDAPLNQPHFNPAVEAGLPLADVVEVGRYAPERFVLGYAPHPKRPDAIHRLKSAVEIYGIRLGGEYKFRLPFDDPDSIDLLRAMGELSLPVTIHLEYGTEYGGANYPWRTWWYGGTIGSLERAVVACPDTIFIGHGPGWWSHISNDGLFDKIMYPKDAPVPGGKNPTMLEEFPNMYADLSGGSGLNAITRDADFGRQYIVDHVDKLLFARDTWDTKLMDHIKTLELPDDVWAKLSHENALRLLGSR
jgi:predicted TIM-barrel fold metal-dependent hydrolase